MSLFNKVALLAALRKKKAEIELEIEKLDLKVFRRNPSFAAKSMKQATVLSLIETFLPGRGVSDYEIIRKNELLSALARVEEQIMFAECLDDTLVAKGVQHTINRLLRAENY